MWIVPLLYRSSRAIAGSFIVFITANLPGFLLYSILELVSLQAINVFTLGEKVKNLRVGDLEVELAAQRIGEVCKKFCLKYTANKGIGLLGRTNSKSKPVIFQFRRADELDCTDGYCSFRGNIQLIIYDALDDNVNIV